MNAALKVLSPGLRTTIQDGGRRGYRRFGVPVSGALDRDGLALANALVGNDPATAGIEVLVLGPTLELLGEGARIAAVGAHLVIGERPLPAGQSGRLVRGSRLLVKPDGGLVSYLAVEGGFDLPPVLGSLSTYAQGALAASTDVRSRKATSPLRRENARASGEETSPPA
jgi:allophanate hydrolase subunit 2